MDNMDNMDNMDIMKVMNMMNMMNMIKIDLLKGFELGYFSFVFRISLFRV